MNDPRWNLKVADAINNTVQQDIENNPIKDTKLLSQIGSKTLWGNYHKGSGYVGEFANDCIPKSIRKYFDGNDLVCGFVKNVNHFKKGSIEEDYELIERVDFEANEYQAQKTYKLFKTKFGDHFIIRTSTKPIVMADETAIIAVDAGDANWSGCWHRPKI